MELFSRLNHLLSKGDALLPLLARFGFAATLLVYFWASAVTKIGTRGFCLLTPPTGPYAQIIPKPFVTVGYDAT